MEQAFHHIVKYLRGSPVSRACSTVNTRGAGGTDDKAGMRALEVQDPDPPPSSDLVKSGPCQSTGQGPDHHLQHQPTSPVSKDEACWSSPGSVTFFLPEVQPADRPFLPRSLCPRLAYRSAPPSITHRHSWHGQERSSSGTKTW